MPQWFVTYSVIFLAVVITLFLLCVIVPIIAILIVGIINGIREEIRNVKMKRFVKERMKDD